MAQLTPTDPRKWMTRDTAARRQVAHLVKSNGNSTCGYIVRGRSPRMRRAVHGDVACARCVQYLAKSHCQGCWEPQPVQKCPGRVAVGSVRVHRVRIPGTTYERICSGSGRDPGPVAPKPWYLASNTLRTSDRGGNGNSAGGPG